MHSDGKRKLCPLHPEKMQPFPMLLEISLWEMQFNGQYKSTVWLLSWASFPTFRCGQHKSLWSNLTSRLSLLAGGRQWDEPAYQFSYSAKSHCKLLKRIHHSQIPGYHSIFSLWCPDRVKFCFSLN